MSLLLIGEIKSAKNIEKKLLEVTKKRQKLLKTNGTQQMI